MTMTSVKESIVNIDAAGVYYRDLNVHLREVVADSVSKIE